MAYDYNIDTPNLFGNFVRGQEITEQRKQRALENQQIEQDRAQKEQDRTQQTVANFSRQWASAAPQAKPLLARVARQAISQNPALAEALGGQVPETDDPAEWDNFMGGGALFDGGSTSTTVQSSFVDGNGDRILIMRDGSRQNAGKNAASTQIIEGADGYYGVDKRDFRATPVRIGEPQQPPQEAPHQEVPLQATGDDGVPPQRMDRGSAMSYVQKQEEAQGFPFPVAQRLQMIDGLVKGGGFDTGAQGGTSTPPQRTTFSDPPGGPILQGPAKAPPAKSALQDRLDIAAARGATKEELDAIATGRDKAAENKPMPITALKTAQASKEKAHTAKTIISSIDKHLGRLTSGKLAFSMAGNLVNKARNAAGQSTEESRNYQEFVSDLEKMRNDSLRLNSGVQTDGDAQRAWNELIANLNDTEYVKQRLLTINELNKQAELLHAANAEETYANYGRDINGKEVGAAPSGAGTVIRYDAKGDRL